MSVARALPHGRLAAAVVEPADTTAVRSRVASFGVIALVAVAPFEAIRPLVQLPGQSLSSVEAVVLVVFAACGLAAVRHAWWRDVPRSTTAMWAAFVGAAIISSLAAPEFRTNALHMTARFAMTAAIWAIVTVGAAAHSDRQRLLAAIFASGVLVALLVVADFLDISGIGRLLSAFRMSVAVVGAQVRASGPFQYPTIASMYLEIAFAIGLGVLVSLEAAQRAVRLVMIAALALIAEAVVLTFTRSGLLTIALSLGIVGVQEWRIRRFRGAASSLVVLTLVIGVELVSSRSLEMLALRLTTEGQGRWFSAVFDVPSRVSLDTRTPIDIPLTITNTGRATWDSDAAEPIQLSYHWVAEDSDEVVAWEGIRTLFGRPVRPGESVSLTAQVGGPGRPGRFRLMWDIEQEHRLWFSTEPDAYIAFSSGVVTGPVTSTRIGTGPRRIPKMAVRPSRLVLWGAAWRMFLARPLVGVGPDNYRLLYGRYSTIKEADPRVHSNSMYFEVLAGAGLIGAAALLGLGLALGRAIMACAEGPPPAPAIAAACAAIAVHGLADSFLSFTGTYILIAVALGLASACARDGGLRAHRV
jgi:hypothetical protein